MDWTHIATGSLLVVDDEPRFRDFVKNVAVKLGFDVECASDGQEFKILCDANHPDVVVLDIVMPGIDGVELVQWLAERGKQVHVVIVTGFAPNYAVLAKKLGQAKGLLSVTTLTKPVKMAALRDAIRNIDVE
jgi:DNA-binding response OmpR family regulator